MTNKEQYKKAFSVLQTSKEYFTEVDIMEKERPKKRLSKMASVLAVFLVVITCSATAYATDIGGIQTKIKAWIAGGKIDVTITDKGNNTYQFNYKEGDEDKEYSGGGVSIDEFGNESSLSGEDIINENNKYASVSEDKDGNILVYYYDQTVNITDMFDEDDICKIALSHEGKTVYVKIQPNGGGGYRLSQSANVKELDKELYKVINEK